MLRFLLRRALVLSSFCGASSSVADDDGAATKIVVRCKKIGWEDDDDEAKAGETRTFAAFAGLFSQSDRRRRLRRDVLVSYHKQFP